MKLYKNLVNAVAGTLQQIFKENRHADKAIEYVLKSNPQWGSRDRRFIAEAVYDITRHYRRYCVMADTEKNFWFLTAAWLIDKSIPVPDWPEFQHVDADQILKRKKRSEQDPATFFSFPDWLWQLGERELGKELWLKEVTAMDEPAAVFLRANTLKCDPLHLQNLLASNKIDVVLVPGVRDGLRLTKRENVFRSPLFKEGLFEVQDAGSQLISEFLNPRPGEFVIDACAGAGGKSLHLAALMSNKGKVISMDVEERKLTELRKRTNRAGAFNVETRLINSPAAISNLAAKADKVLLDVPCSGLGVLKRNPDSKWKLREETMVTTRNIQHQILSDYSAMVKPGGVLVYSTCSILPSENENQVKKFLEQNNQFVLEQEKHIWPSEGFDGFYMARLTRRS
jgi:16S rRNA (cytosine967-C5)-methyltransferase